MSWIILGRIEHIEYIEKIVDLRRDQPVQRQRMDGSIGIDREQVLVERRIDTNDILDLVVDLELQGVHRSVEVNLEEVQQR